MKKEIGNLAMTVKQHEKIYIGNDIVVSIGIDKGKNAWRFHVSAPKDLNIIREFCKNREDGKND